jgi:hypothetical protein
MTLLFAIDITFNWRAFIIRIISNLTATRKILIYIKLRAILIKNIIIYFLQPSKLLYS